MKNRIFVQLISSMMMLYMLADTTALSVTKTNFIMIPSIDVKTKTFTVQNIRFMTILNMNV